MSSSSSMSFKLAFFVFVALWFCGVVAQSTSQPSSTASASQSQNSTASSTSSANVTTVLTTSSFTTTSVSHSGNRDVTVTTVLPTTFNATITQTAAASSTANATASATPIALETKLDPAFGVLGALLILSGVPMVFLGHKNRWTSFFLTGFYTLSLVCFVLIINYGVLPSVHPPSATLRGLFVLACVIAGIAGGGITIFFWNQAKFFMGAWGGLAFGLWIQCFRNGGVVRPIGLRWLLFIGCATIGFVLCTIKRFHYQVVLVSTAFLGASVVMLGVDCFTTADLKEFYVWNLGFSALFPKFTSNGIQFPVSQTMQIELGLLAAIALAGAAVQLRVLGVLQRKLKEIEADRKKRDEEENIDATERFAGVLKEREEWEREHGSHGRSQSNYSGMPLLKDQGSSSPAPTDTLTAGEQTRAVSGLSDYFAVPTTAEDEKRPGTPGTLNALDLGTDLESDMPKNFIAEGHAAKDGKSQSREDLMNEIDTIRRSIDLLKSETPSLASGSRSRHPSLTSKRTLSQDLGGLMAPSHLRPPKDTEARSRVQSMELTTFSNKSAAGAGISRPNSAPLRDEDWDAYVRDRKLLHPPSGVTPPISPGQSDRIAMSPAVAEAISSRKQRESAYELGEAPHARAKSPMVRAPSPVAAPEPVHQRRASTGKMPVTILPPKREVAAPTPKQPEPRTFTMEELTARHREKMRSMQAPLTQAEREHADVEAAKNRWERSKAVERQVVERRQAEKAAQAAKDDKKRGGERGRRERDSQLEPAPRHERSLSADKLATLGRPGSNPKRLSEMRIESWQRDQQELAKKKEGGGVRRDSKTMDKAAVPFPGPSGDRRRGSGVPR